MASEFQEIREYTPGDDIRSIDWNVTARHGRPYVKRFVQEREQTIMVLADVSASTRFGRKSDVIAELVATLAYAAIANADRVGMILFGSEIECYVPPAGAANQAFRLIRELSTLTPSARGTDVTAALRFLDRVIPRRVFALLISDFFASDISPQLRTSSKRHNLVAVSVNDPLELDLPACGLIEVRDPESRAHLLLDTSDARVRQEFAEQARERQSRLHEMLRTAQVDHFPVLAGEDYFPRMMGFLKDHATSR